MISYFVGNTVKDVREAYNEITRKMPVYSTSNGCSIYAGELNVEYDSRRLYFVTRHSKRLIRGAERIFKTTEEALAWLLGRTNVWSLEENGLHFRAVNPYNYYIVNRRKEVPNIKKIDRNIKKDKLYTTVVWDDGSPATVVRMDANDEREDIFQAVASAIAIKLYGSNSAFQREVLKKKTDDCDMVNILADIFRGMK